MFKCWCERGIRLRGIKEETVAEFSLAKLIYLLLF